MTALLDWEFCGVGPAIGDIAWCEWIVRMQHPNSTRSLAAFFDGYGERPTWDERGGPWLPVAARSKPSHNDGIPRVMGCALGKNAPVQPKHGFSDWKDAHSSSR